MKVKFLHNRTGRKICYFKAILFLLIAKNSAKISPRNVIYELDKMKSMPCSVYLIYAKFHENRFNIIKKNKQHVTINKIVLMYIKLSFLCDVF